MRLEIVSPENFIIDNLAVIIESYIGKKHKGYSNAIEFGVSELVRAYMRKIARKDEEIYSRHQGILEQAVAITERKIQSKLKENRIEFDFSQYFKNIKDNLKSPAKEITDLKGRLFDSKEVKRIGERKIINNQPDIPVEITEVGLRNSIEGLLALPLVDKCEIDFESIEGVDSVVGEGFPYELNIDEFTFVIDDDGSIFVSTENFPKTLIEKARDTLKRLVRQLYVQ